MMSLFGTLLIFYNEVSKIAVYGFMNPIFGALLSAIFLQESKLLSFRSLLSLVLVALGIILVNVKMPAENLSKNPDLKKSS